MQKFYLCISSKKLIHHGTHFVCLEVLADMVADTVSVQVKDVVKPGPQKSTA